MVFEIFSYWNMRELELVFNAVASIVGSGDYLGLMRTLAIVGLLSMAMAVLAGFSQLPDFGRWVIMLAVFNGMLLVPKVTVVLTDRTGTEAPRTVANVPIGLAAFAHSVSHIGDWLTTTYETTFSLPSDIQFRTNGTLFGHRVQQEILHTKFDSSILNSNLLEFYRECVAPEFATGFIVASDMAKSNDIWTYLSGKTNPGRLVTIRAVPGSTPLADTYGCDVAYGHLGTQITYVNTQQMNAIGKRLYPGLPTAAANAAVQSSIQTSTNYMLGISKSAMDITKQTAMSNFMIDAQYMLPAQIGDAAGAAANLAQAQAIRSTSESYKLMAKVGESTMPKIKNIIEVVQYSIFPIIMLLILMAGHKGGLVLKAYVMSLVWVQLWPPLYAVMHMIMTIHSQELAALTSGMGLSMAEYNQVNNAYISDEAIAGMIAATAIPMIASAIVKGGDVGASALGGAISSPSQQATQAATAASQGNFNMGNASLGNQSADNLSMGQVNARPTLSQGGMQMTGADNVSHFYGKNGEVINNSAAMQNIGMNLKASGRTAGSLTKTSEKLESAALAEMTSASDNMTAARSQFGSFEKNHGKGTRAGTTNSTGSTAQFLKSYGSEQAIADKFATEHGLKQEQMAQIQAFARAEASGGLQTPLGGATVSGGVQTTGSSSAGTTQNQKLAHELAQKKDFKEAVTSTNTASHQKDFARGEDAGSKAAKGIRANLDESRTHMDSSSANHTKADSFKDAASRTTENAAGFDANANNQFMDFMRGQVNPTSGKNFTGSEVEEMSRRGDLNEYAQKFTDQVLVPEIESKIPTPTNNVEAQHNANKKAIPGTDDVTAFNASNQAAVATQQGNAGVTVGKGPKDTVSPAVTAMLGAADKQIDLGNSGIQAEGKPLKDSVTQNTDPTRQNNLGLATQNAVASVAPEGTMKLMDNMGMVSSDAGVAKPSADKFQGSLTDAAIDTAIFAGGFALGGVGGKVLTKIGGEGASVAARVGGLTGDAAEATAFKVAAKTEERVAAHGLEKEAAALATPEVQAATKAAAAKAGAKAEVGAQQTVEGVGKIGGVVAGGLVANQITGEQGALNQPIIQPAIEAVKKTDAAVLDIVSDVANAAKEHLPTAKK
jgi:conjugal transfer mating pair stabilization protein TraG